MKKTDSVFSWRGQPSTIGKQRQHHIVVNPNSVKFNGSPLIGSIATLQPAKRKPGVGVMRTA